MSNYQHWYYINKNYEEDGPVSSDELTEMARNGDIHRGTYVWTQELEEWVPASKVGGLFVEKEKEIIKPLNQLSKKTGDFSVKSEAIVPAPPEKQAKATFKPGDEPQRFTQAAPVNVPPIHSTGDTSKQTIAASSSPAQPAQPAQETNGKGPVPLTAPQEIVPKPLTSRQPLRAQSPVAQPATPNKANAHGKVAIPLTAPQSIVPTPLTSRQPIRAHSGSATPLTSSAPIHTPPGAIPPASSAAGASSIPAPQLARPANQPPQGAAPPAPSAPGAPAPIDGLPTIPPVGRSIAPPNQSPTTALSSAESAEPKKISTPTPMQRPNL